MQVANSLENITYFLTHCFSTFSSSFFMNICHSVWNIQGELVSYLPCQCHGLVAATGYSDIYFPYQTADSSFSISNLISSPLPIVVAKCFFTLLVPSPSFLPLLSPSGTFCSRLPYVSLPFGSLCTLPMCSG